MPGDPGTPPERVNAFPLDGTILFKHYFDGDHVFDRLKPHYNGTQYRFEVPADEFDSLRRFLRENGYHLELVEHPVDYAVAVRQYTAHPDGIFTDSVHQESVDGYNCFLMTDRAAVAAAVADGATPLTDLPLAVQSGSLGDFSGAAP